MRRFEDPKGLRVTGGGGGLRITTTIDENGNIVILGVKEVAKRKKNTPHNEDNYKFKGDVSQ